MIAGMLLLNQVLQEKEQRHKEKTNNDNNAIDNAYFTEIRDIKGNLKEVKLQ